MATSKPASNVCACFYCWYRQRKCRRQAPNESCPECQSLTVENSKPLRLSPVDPPLRQFISHHTTPFVFSETSDIFLTLQISTTEPRSQEAPSRIFIDDQFYPNNDSLRTQMDDMVYANLALSVHGISCDSDLIRQAALAGGYLSLIFPATGCQLDMDESTPHISQHAKSSSDISQQELRAHLLKFCIIRFDQISANVLRELRGIDTNDRNRSECSIAIAASAVLYCKIQAIKQGFHKALPTDRLRLSCESSELQSTLRVWLLSLGREILARLRKTCGSFPLWAESLEQPWKEAKRDLSVTGIRLDVSVERRHYQSSYNSPTVAKISFLSDGPHSSSKQSSNTTILGAKEEQGPVSSSHNLLPDTATNQSIFFFPQVPGNTNFYSTEVDPSLYFEMNWAETPPDTSLDPNQRTGGILSSEHTPVSTGKENFQHHDLNSNSTMPCYVSPAPIFCGVLGDTSGTMAFEGSWNSPMSYPF